MGFGTWIPLVLLILVPVILILYMLKQKAQEYEFSSSLLWREIYRNIEATKPWEKLRKNLLMILQMIGILLLMIALMAPYLKSQGTGQKNAILVIDCSASMNTLYDGKKTRLEAAKEKACDYIDNLGTIGTVTVISSSDRGNLILTNSRDQAEIKEKIRGISPTNLPGTVTESLSLVQSAAAQWENSQILFFTDTAFDSGTMKAGIVTLYSDVVNLSLDYMNCSETENGLTVLIRVTNHSDQTLNREINLYGKEKLLDIQQVTLAPGETKVIYFEKVQPDGVILRAEFQESDDLEGDNSIFCVIEEHNISRILLVTQSNLFLEKALLNLAGIEVYRTGDITQIPSDENSFDLYILDGITCLESDLPEQGNLLLINSSVDGITREKEHLSNRILTFSEGELTGYIAKKEFGVNAASAYELPAWGNQFITSGDSTTGYFGEHDGRRIAVMGFDLHQTDLGLQAPFPVLISNMMEYLLERGLVSQDYFLAGDQVLLNGSSRGENLEIRKPDGTADTMEPSSVSTIYTGADDLGVYEVSQRIDGQEIAQHFAVNFPVTSESSVESVHSVIADNQEEILIEGAVDLKRYILLLLIGLLLVEWYVYVKRT